MADATNNHGYFEDFDIFLKKKSKFLKNFVNGGIIGGQTATHNPLTEIAESNTAEKRRLNDERSEIDYKNLPPFQPSEH